MSAWARGLFEPKSVAIIGASDQTGSLGHLFVQNLFPPIGVSCIWSILQVIAGRAAYPSIMAIPPRSSSARMRAVPTDPVS